MDNIGDGSHNGPNQQDILARFYQQLLELYNGFPFDTIIPELHNGDNSDIDDFNLFVYRVHNNIDVDIADERNNPPVELNRQNDDNIGVVAGIGNDIAHEAVEEAVDVHQDIPEEEPLPGVSRKRSRELDDEGREEDHNGLRWYESVDSDSDRTDSDVDDPEDINQQVAEEMLPSGSTKRSREEDVEDEEHASKKIRLANPDPEACPNASSHTERGSDEPFEDAPQELDIHRAGGSRKRSREDCEEEEEDLSPRKFRRSSNESTSSTEDNQ